jgi:putative intracellular protease/amidase
MWLNKRALFIVTSHAQLGALERPTGLYLAELAEPYAVLKEQGVAVEVASPKGGAAPVDPCSRSAELAPLASLATETRPLGSSGSAYDAYLVVGGRGALWDLAHDHTLVRLLAEAYDGGKVVAALSQGAAALLELTDREKAPWLRGRRLTTSTDQEELQAGFASALPFSLEHELRARGARVETGAPWSPHVVTEARLVTGQNPGSATSVARAIARLLEET